MQNDQEQPSGVLPLEAANIFMRDPLSSTLKEFSYAIVQRDMQIAQLQSKVKYMEKMYLDLKEEMMKTALESQQQNGAAPHLEVVES